MQLSAASALAAGTGGLAGILASGRAPAYAQTQTLHWLRWADFVPASDVLLKGDIVKLCEKELSVKLMVETINANDIQGRITAAIQSGAGPDIFMTVGNWPQALRRQLHRCQRRGRRSGQSAGRLLRHLQRHLYRGRKMDRRGLVHGRRSHLLSQVLAYRRRRQ
jgi:multiple sugar transport system substrate-binding protein